MILNQQSASRFLIPYISFLILINFSNVNAQERFTCATDILHQEKMKTDANYKVNYEYINNEIYKLAKGKLIKGKAKKESLPTYVIPVVLHIITPPGTAIGAGNNITDVQAELGIQLLNDAYANAGTFKTTDGVDVGISFCLAKRDPDGKPTNGITRTESSLVADLTPCSPFGTNADNDNLIKGLISWDCKKYLNVWLVTDLYNGGFGCSLAGYATFPGAGCGYDGIVQESRYWITKGGATVSAHEVGHYLSLNHTFNGGCLNNDCLLDGDQVCDTPPDGSPSFAACNTNSCATDIPDLVDDNTNYMDYTSCTPPHFTAGQRDRMISGLEKGRASLLTSQGCIPVINLDVALLEFKLLSGGCGNSLCAEVTIQNTGINTITVMEIHIKVDGVNALTFPWSGNLSSNSKITITLPCFNIILGLHTLTAEIIKPNNGTDGYTANNIIDIKDLTIFDKPDLKIVSVDSSHCGNNGKIVVKTSGGKEPYQYIISSFPLEKQLTPIFYDLHNQVYTIIVQDANNCTDTLYIKVPDVCPPCISGIINKYAAIYSFCDTATLLLDDASGFKPGDKIMIYQAKGATIDSTNTAAFGDILDYGNSGNYEYNQIAKIEGNTITLKYLLLRKYDIPGRPQVINIPDLGDATICNLTCAPWDGFKGGVLIFESNKLTMVGNIDVSEKGFKGGIVQQQSKSNPPFDGYFSATYNDGAEKGEGIANLFGLQYRYAKGKKANGGGGGNDHNAGGGGGANYGNGGKGGMGYLPTNYPGIQGIGGVSLNYPGLPDNIFIGGGGGAGHSNYPGSGSGTSGGKGGGIAIINTQSCMANNNKILANGENAKSPGALNGADGAGGGGAGGVIIINCPININNLSLEANGGNGGDVYYQGYIGPGGGGGGGLIMTTIPLPPIVTMFEVFGGNNGKLNQFDDYGATPGESGFIKGDINIPVASIPYIPIGNVNIKIDTFCFGSGFMQVTVTNGTNVPEFKLDEGLWQSFGAFEALSEGLHKLSIRTKCNQLDTLIYIGWPKPLTDSLLFLNPLNCKFNGKLGVVGLNGSPPYSYKINNGPSQLTGIFENLTPGDYTISIIDNKGCKLDKVFKIEDQFKELNLVTDSFNLEINCGDTTAFIAVHADGTSPYYYYSLNNGTKQPIGLFQNLSVGNNSIIAYDEYGCVSKQLDFDVIKTGVTDTTYNDIELCAGQSVTVNGHVYSFAGNYYDTLKTSEGCDSLIITNLVIHPNYYINNTLTICNGDSIKIGNNIYKTSGNYVDQLHTQFGCDSFFNTFLTVVPFKSTNQIINLCQGDELKVGNHIYNTSGNYIDTLIAKSGCDSIISTALYVGNSSFSNLQIKLCEGESITINNKVYNKEGNYTDTLNNFIGCDSIINIKVGVINSIVQSSELNICNGDTVRFGDKYFTIPGIYKDTLSAFSGCDSIVLINVIKTEESICDSVNCRMYIPSAFSPNTDGINDYFEVFTPISIVNEMEIYDRWGELVIALKGLNPKWNGRSSKGKNMHQGVYIYLIRGKCGNGLDFFKFGEVTLIR